MTRAKGYTKIGIEEHGQRAARSTDVYISKEGMKEVALCTKCKALYWNKRWYLDEDESTKLSLNQVSNKVVCPACQRMKDNNPAGIVTFSGDYLVEHEDDILNKIKKIEAAARKKNPLARIMEISQENDLLTVHTTDDKLAQKLGREIFRAHSGKLDYQWSHEYKFVRVNWSR